MSSSKYTRSLVFIARGPGFTLPMSLQEKTALNLSEFLGCGAFFVVVRQSMKPTVFQHNSTLTATLNFE